MGKYLRDAYVKNVSLDEKGVVQIGDFFTQKEKELNSSLGNLIADKDKFVVATFVIRFDNKGYRFHDLADMMKCYREAKNIERLVFTLESVESALSNRINGTLIELKFDSNDVKNTSMTIAGDDRSLVDSFYTNLCEVIAAFNNIHYVFRNEWTVLLVQIFGVIAAFAVSLLTANKIAPHLKTQSPFMFSFILIFLVWSNIWGYLNQKVLSLINFAFPNVRFKRSSKDALHWMLQTVIGGIVLAVILYLLGEVVGYIKVIIKDVLV